MEDLIEILDDERAAAETHATKEVEALDIVIEKIRAKESLNLAEKRTIRNALFDVGPLYLHGSASTGFRGDSPAQVAKMQSIERRSVSQARSLGVNVRELEAHRK